MKTSNLLLTFIITVMVAMTGLGAADAATPPPDREKAQNASRIRHEGFGVLKAVNKEAAKVQLAHEAIPPLHWPPMTMWFALLSPLPGNIKVGDNVRFELEQPRPGEWVITRIERKR